MDFQSGIAVPANELNHFKNLAVHDRKCRFGVAGGFALGLILCPTASIAGSAKDRELAARIEAAPDAITLGCNSPYDANVVTISRKLRAMVSVTNGDDDDPTVMMAGVPLQGSVPLVVVDEKGARSQWQSFAGSMSIVIDLPSLTMWRSGMGVDIRASCHRIQTRH
jgi:hypothetical protein